jgi:hypothetical protein
MTLFNTLSFLSLDQSPSTQAQFAEGNDARISLVQNMSCTFLTFLHPSSKLQVSSPVIILDSIKERYDRFDIMTSIFGVLAKHILMLLNVNFPLIDTCFISLSHFLCSPMLPLHFDIICHFYFLCSRFPFFNLA